jgi:chorismate mutase
MDISRQIGEYKKNNNVAMVQALRWDNLLDKVVEKGLEQGLSDKFITDVFNAIHEASLEVQNDIISDKNSM